MNEYKYACLRKHFLPTLAGFICINTYSHVHLSSPDSWSLEETQPVLAHPELSGRVVNACFDLSASQRESSPKALWPQAEDAHADLCPLAPGLCPVSHCSNLGAVGSCVTDSFSWCPVPLQAAPLLVHVSSFAATSHKKKLYVIGGGPNGKLATDKTQCYDPSTNKWSLKSSMPVEAKCINAVSFRDRIYVVGKWMNGILFIWAHPCSLAGRSDEVFLGTQIPGWCGWGWKKRKDQIGPGLGGIYLPVLDAETAHF